MIEVKAATAACLPATLYKSIRPNLPGGDDVESMSLRSVCTGLLCPPAAMTRSAISSIVSSRSSGDRWSYIVRPVQYTVAPCVPSSTAVPRPAPRVAPLMSRTIPCIDIIRDRHRSTALRTGSTR